MNALSLCSSVPSTLCSFLLVVLALMLSQAAEAGVVQKQHNAHFLRSLRAPGQHQQHFLRSLRSSPASEAMTELEDEEVGPEDEEAIVEEDGSEEVRPRDTRAPQRNNAHFLRSLRAPSTHFLRSLRSPGRNSHFLRSLRSQEDNMDIDEDMEMDMARYLSGQNKRNSHFLRSLRSGIMDASPHFLRSLRDSHYLRALRAAQGGFFLRPLRSSLEEEEPEMMEQFASDKRSTNSHFLRSL